MQACDRAAIEEYRIPGIVLMENAGLQVLDVLLEMNDGASPLSTAVVCGSGNNGGDGYVVARHLHNLGREAVVYLVADPERLRGDALLNYQIAIKFGVPIRAATELTAAEFANALAGYEFVVDALLGTGIEGPVRGPARVAIQAINEAGRPVLAVDLPSGVEADGGGVMGEVVRAQSTVALAALKSCHVLSPACEACGEVVLAEISIPADVIDAAEPRLLLGTAESVAMALPPRPAGAHKGTQGRVLVCGGAVGTAGAVVLAARGALRTGAGLVDVACPQAIYDLVGAGVTEALVHPWDEAESTPVLDEWIAAANALVVGPGLGTGSPATELARSLVRSSPVPTVVDADGLNALVGDLEPLREAPAARILTPHPGEAGRLLEISTADVQGDRVGAARALADRSGSIVVLKGHRTLIAAPGEVTVVNPTGNPGMATGGTGDVLAGVIGALVGQGTDPFRAAWVGAWLHGTAGDLVASDLGEASLIAGDLADALPAAFAVLESAP